MTTSLFIQRLAEPAAASMSASVQAGYGISLTDTGAFDQAIARLAPGHGLMVQAPAPVLPSPAIEALMKPLEQINLESSQLSTQANVAVAEGRSLSPSEMVSLTVKCHEFMFHCQLTASVANRTSDGLQQLFRQQS